MKQREEETENRKAKILFHFSDFWNLAMCCPFKKANSKSYIARKI